MCVESLAMIINEMGVADEYAASKPPLIDGRSILPYLDLSTKTHPHLFITIGLSREKEPDSLYRDVLTLTPRVTQLIRGLAVMEFIPHPHVHILVDKPAKYHKGNLIKQIARCLGITRNTLIDISIGSKDSDYQSRLSYIQGTKSEDSKMVRVEEDRQIRDNYNIPHFICL